MTSEFLVLALNKHNNMAGLNLLMGSQSYSLDNRISNGDSYTYTCMHTDEVQYHQLIYILCINIEYG
jgi:hypothetical protein